MTVPKEEPLHLKEYETASEQLMDKFNFIINELARINEKLDILLTERETAMNKPPDFPIKDESDIATYENCIYDSNMEEKVCKKVKTKKQSFPIKNDEELVAYENYINDSNMDDNILQIKKIIGHMPIRKSLLHIISEDIIRDYNIDGKQKKRALNSFPKFLDILFRSYEQHESFPEFRVELRTALRRIKSRQYTATFVKKQKDLFL